MASDPQELLGIYRELAVATDPTKLLRRLVALGGRLDGVRAAVLTRVESPRTQRILHAVGASAECLLGSVLSSDEPTQEALSGRLKVEGPERLLVVPFPANGQAVGHLAVVHAGAEEILQPLQALAECAGLCLELASARSSLRQGDAEVPVDPRDTFTAVASHELRTPVTALRLQLQGLQRWLGGAPPLPVDRVQRGVHRAIQQCDLLVQLTDLLLDSSLLTAGQLRLERSEVDVSRLVEDAVRSLHEELVHARCALALHVQPGVRGLFDPLRLTQVLVHLVSNSIKYAPGRPIEVSLHAEGEWVHLTIKDQGEGVAEEDLERIFARFERAPGAIASSGLGLGLYICRQLIEAHQGAIRVESKPGEGAAFRIDLPRHPGPLQGNRS